jgi:ATP-binding cassette subfamily C protein
MDFMEQWLKILAKDGQTLKVAGNKPIILTETQKLWILVSGQIDIFWVLIKEDKIIGPRKHILRLQENDFFIGLNFLLKEIPGTFLAVGKPGTVLKQCDLSELIQLARDLEYKDIIIESIEKSLNTFYRQIYSTEKPAETNSHFKSGMTYNITEGTDIYGQDDIIWCKSFDGQLQFMGKEGLLISSNDAFFPFSKACWLHAKTPVTLFVQSTHFILENDLFITSLKHFYYIIINWISLINENDKEKSKERVLNKFQLSRHRFTSSLKLISSIFQKTDEESLPIPEEPFSDPLLTACRMVGETQGIPIRTSYRSLMPSGQKINLEEIERLSKFKTRKVILKTNWWRKDNGNLLAFTKDNHQPIALLTTSPGKYYLYDPISKKRTKVTSQIANSVDIEAYYFYRPFPMQPLSGTDIIKFGIRGCKSDINRILVTCILGTLLSLLTPVLTRVIFDTVIPLSARGQLHQIISILIACAITITIFEITKTLALLRIEGKMGASLQASLWERLINLPVQFFRQYSTGDLTYRGMGFDIMHQTISNISVVAILAFFFSSFNLVLMFYYSWKLALLVTTLTIIVALFIGVISYMQVRYQRKVFDIEGKTAGVVLQFINGIAKLRNSGTEEHAFGQWANKYTQQKRLSFKAGILENVLDMFNAVYPILILMVIFAWVFFKGQIGTEEGFTPGKFLAFNAAYGNLQNAMLQVVMSLNAVLRVIPLYERAKPILLSIPESNDEKVHPEELNGDIEISHINFRYKTEGPLVLKDISITILPREFIAIVGESGSGKSTIFRLLLGFEKLESGSIYYSGQDLAQLDTREVRRQIGAVLQNSKLIPYNIFRNIVGSSDLTHDDAWKAARIVGIEEDIRKMPMGMHTLISESGGNISAGQRQRLMIARAIVRKPKILLLDEATSFLDNKTQAFVMENLKKLNATRVIIAQRLSTVVNADKIYVLHKGEIVESGTFEELISHKGMFFKLSNRQLL